MRELTLQQSSKAMVEMEQLLPELKNYHRRMVLASFALRFKATGNWEQSINATTAEFSTNWL